MVLRYGAVVPLVARKKENVWHERVAVFARYSLLETAIIATNFSDELAEFWIDMSALEKICLENCINNTIIMVEDWLKVN